MITSSRSDGSEDEVERRPTSASSESELSHSPQTQGWILVKNEAGKTTETIEVELDQVTLRAHRSSALARCAEALALVIRDVAHVTPHNCRAAVRAVRLLARATLHSGKSNKIRAGHKSGRGRTESSDEDDTLDSYHMLLDLMHTLHSRTAQIFKWWRDEADQGQGAEEYDLWEVAWKPLLQGIAEFCTDRRKQVSNSAIAYLQRALLAPALASLGGAGWEACFSHVLLPLLNQPPPRHETAARANTLMCKVFLQHLQALSGRATFASLWTKIVRVQQSLLQSSAEPLREGALESLKNMLLVMHSVKIFSNGDGYNDLWYLTWDIIGEFLPNLKQELFPDVDDNTKPTHNLPSHMQPAIPHSLPTLIPVGSNSMPNNPYNANVPQNSSHPTANAPAFAIPQPLPTPNIISHQIQSSPVHIQRQTPNILVGSVASSPINLPLTPPTGPTLIAPIPVPGTVQQVAPQMNQVPQTNQQVHQTNDEHHTETVQNVGCRVVSPTLGPPVSGMVSFRNPLYEQSSLTSSVLLQPLNEMISTPIGISIQSQPSQPTSQLISPPLNQSTDLIASSRSQEDSEPTHTQVQQTEIFAEYLTNPYHDVTISTKEATLYEPENESVLSQKSFSANVTPLRSNKAQFGSTDNVRESGIFNFASYFSSGMGSEFDTLMSTQEG
ncbi:unnamed protein product [Leptosia nina]|uniref:GBF1-like tetratricopeptide repeats domain-containing protein n=1 Tax=Leptosia nina TaxID=320188 RepID=A0AAV1JQJ7_9NEOP